MLSDRNEAAKLLAKKLDRYRGKNPLVVAIPLGAVESVFGTMRCAPLNWRKI